jgi:8-oxo-dGTP pyrophosphatase MutT (NUDIX family)
VGALILNKEATHFLLGLQRRSIKWGVPKGGKTPDYEDPIMCMHREVYEETGLNLMLVAYHILGILRFDIHYASNITPCIIYVLHTKLRHTFSFRPPLEEGVPNHEIKEVRWFKPDEFDVRNHRRFNYPTITAYKIAFDYYGLRPKLSQSREW